MTTIEAQYQSIRAKAISTKPGAVKTLMTLLAEANAAETRIKNLSSLRSKSKRERRTVLERAVARMHVDDLDAAWRAALRGDLPAALLRVADHVTEAPVELQGTPWRLTGWLSKR
jgi:hypothetical protein